MKFIAQHSARRRIRTGQRYRPNSSPVNFGLQCHSGAYTGQHGCAPRARAYRRLISDSHSESQFLRHLPSHCKCDITRMARSTKLMIDEMMLVLDFTTRLSKVSVMALFSAEWQRHEAVEMGHEQKICRATPNLLWGSELVACGMVFGDLCRGFRAHGVHA